MIKIKPWLFDILACPMDKHYPLKLFIFSYEEEDDFKSILDSYEKREKDNNKIVEIFKEKEILYIKDNIFIEKNPVEKYLTLILSSINELDNITDKSQSDISKKCFELIKTEVKKKIQKVSKSEKIDNIDDVLPELLFLNRIKIETEIESGLLFCEKCNRWFPIIETIPQMLPDEYRDETKETGWIKSKEDLLDEAFIKQDLKPFNI